MTKIKRHVIWDKVLKVYTFQIYLKMVKFTELLLKFAKLTSPKCFTFQLIKAGVTIPLHSHEREHRPGN